MTDNEQWKSKERPQSTIARNFSASLNDAFAMDSRLDGLVQSVEQKKQAVTSQSQELEALEAKLKETEERLKQRQSSPAAKAVGGSNSSNSPHRRKPIGDAFSGQENDRLQPSTSSPLGTQPPASSSVSPSTMSHWRPAAQEGAPAMSGTTGYGDVERTGSRQQSQYAE